MVRQIFFDCTKCICSLLYRALNVIGSVRGSWLERHCPRSWKIAKDFYEGIPRSVMQMTKYLGVRGLLPRAKTGSAGLCLSNMNASTACCRRNTAYTNPFSAHMTPTLIVTRIRSKAVPWDYLISGPVTSLSTLCCEVLMKHDSAASKDQYKQWMLWFSLVCWRRPFLLARVWIQFWILRRSKRAEHYVGMKCGSSVGLILLLA